MSEEEYKNHVEALTVKRLDKPKKLSSECMKHWKEILSRQYNFGRGEDSENDLWLNCNEFFDGRMKVVRFEKCFTYVFTFFLQTISR